MDGKPEDVKPVLTSFQRQAQKSGAGDDGSAAASSSATDATQNTQTTSNSKNKLTTRGGVAKKVFQPKVPVRRAKKTPPQSANVSGAAGVTGRGGRSSGRRGRGRGRGSGDKQSRGQARGRGKNSYYQSQEGIFSQGFGVSPDKTKLASKPAGSSKSSAGGPKRSTSNSSAGVRRGGSGDRPVAQEEKAPQFSVGFAADMVESDSDIEDTPSVHFMGVADHCQPMNLPLHSGVRTSHVPENKSQAPIATFPTKEDIDSVGQKLMFLQLPQVLPLIQSEPSNGTAESNIAEKGIKLETSLGNLGSGKIAKLQIRKSGRMELVFESHRMTLNQGTAMGFAQRFVCIDPSTVKDGVETGAGRMVEIGDLLPEHRYVAVPITSNH